METINMNKAEQNSLLTVFDTNLIQNIFKKLFKKYKYKIQYKLSILESQYSDSEEEKYYKKGFFKISNFKLVCSLFNNISKQTLFNLNIYNIKFKIPYNLHLKLSYIYRRVKKPYDEKTIDSMLIYCCENGFYDIIKTLIKQGKLNINKLNQYTSTPLLIATRFKNIKTIKELFKFKNLDINLGTLFRYTPLAEACEKGFEDIVSLFLSRNDLNINIQDNSYSTPLIRATIYKQENIVSLLLSRNDVDPNIQDDRGFTTLMYAVLQNNENIVSLLISQKNRININLKDKNQKTALDWAKQKKYKIWAKEKKNQNIIKMLNNFEGNYDINKKNITVVLIPIFLCTFWFSYSKLR